MLSHESQEGGGKGVPELLAGELYKGESERRTAKCHVMIAAGSHLLPESSEIRRHS